MRCIYCGTLWSGMAHRAHIFPASIFGEHEYLHLERGEICPRCNNRTAKLESDFKQSLGLLHLIYGASLNRRGEPSRIERRGLLAVKDPRDPWILLNTSTRPLRARDHTIVPPAKNGEDFVFTDPVRKSDGVHMTIRQRMPIDKKFRRVLAKIAFETLAFERGAGFCCQERFDGLRNFVMKGKGHRAFAMPRELATETAESGRWETGVGVTILQMAAPGDLVALLGVGVPFTVDLSPDGQALKEAFETLAKEIQDRFVLFGVAKHETPAPILEFHGEETAREQNNS